MINNAIASDMLIGDILRLHPEATIICREQLIQESLPLESLDHRFALTVTEKEIYRQSNR